MADAKDSGERGAVGPKTHISLKSAVVIVALLVIPMTLFLGQMSSDIKEIKSMFAAQQKQIDDHETRLRKLEDEKRLGK